MVKALKTASEVAAQRQHRLNFLFNVAEASWFVLFAGLLVSFGLLFAGLAHSTAETVASWLFVAGVVGFCGALLTVLALEAPSMWTSTNCSSTQ